MFLVVASMLATMAAPPVAAPPAGGVAITRLAAVGRLWGKVRYLHPYLAYRDVDWDAALLHALPGVRAARDTAAYRAAVAAMLAELGDPATYLRSAAPPAGGRLPAGELIRPLDGAAKGALLIDLGHQAASQGGNEVLRQLELAMPRLAAAPELVIDLRSQPGDEPAAWTLSLVAGAIVSRTCPGVSKRYLVRSGFTSQMNLTATYFSGFLQRFGTAYEPDARLKPVDKRVAFVTDRATPLPDIALALQACGEARIVAVGGLDPTAAADSIDVPLGEELTAQVRVSELLPRAGGPAADAIVAEADAAGAIDAACASLAREQRLPAAPAAPAAPTARLPDGVFRFDRTYPEMLAPDLDHRQLAVIRAWNVIELFYPYRHLIGDWDAVLPEFLARMETAEGDRAYALAILAMMNRVADGHVGLSGHPVLDHLTGFGAAAARMRWVEGGPVIAQVSDAVRQAGAAPGDAIRAIDGEAVAAILARLRPLVTASTEGALHQRLCSMLLRGQAGTTVNLTLESPQGTVHHAVVAYTSGNKPLPLGASTLDVVQILPGNLGYVDLTRLTVAEVDGMFERLKGTRGLVFDMRGYPQGTAWAIAPRINTRHAKVGALFRRVELSAFSADEGNGQFLFEQPLPENSRDLPLYDKPIAMIIDARAISQSEHSGLFFEAASDIHFVGENSAGANGDVTVMTLPGGIRVSFTGHDVRHADGRQLQRIGLVPDVPASPTRAGLAAGRDEMLEAAVADLERRAAPPGAAARSPSN